MAPGDWVIHRDFLQNTKVTVSVQAPLDILLPVERYLAGGVHCYGGGIIIHKYAEGRRAIHERECLFLAAIKGTAAVPIQYVLLEGGQVGWSRSTG